MGRQYAPARASPWHTYSTGQSIDEPGVVTVKSPNLTSQSLRTFEPYSSENVRKPALSFLFLLHTLSLPSKSEGAEAGASPNPTPGGVDGTLLRAHHPGSISSTTSNTPLHTLSLPSTPEGAEAGESPNPTPGGVAETLLWAHHLGSISSTTSNTPKTLPLNSLRTRTQSDSGLRLV